MKRFLIAVALGAASLTAPVVSADISISIGQPGFYGRLDIGDYPQPQVIYREPRVIERVVVNRPPIYLRVPPGHAKNWSKHCRAYNACGERVLFVQDNWYQRVYVPHYRQQHQDRRDHGRSEGKDDRRAENRNERNDDNHDRGRGRAH